MRIALILLAVFFGLVLLGLAVRDKRPAAPAVAPAPVRAAAPAPASVAPAATGPVAPTPQSVVYVAREALRRALKNPDGAKFPADLSEYGYENSGGGVHRVSGYVDATNSFNATLREKWLVEVQESGPGEFKPQFIKLGGKVLFNSRGVK